MSGAIVVAGALARRPNAGGHAWVFLQYLLGFRRLGYDVLFIDQLDADSSTDVSGNPTDPARSTQCAELAALMQDAGLGNNWVLVDRESGHTIGRERSEVEAILDGSVLLLNVMGYLDDPGLRDRAPMRVFLDIDPGVGQMWQALGLARLFDGHDRYVTVGTRIGEPGCRIPTLGLDWVPTVPPVVLAEWPAVPLPSGPTTDHGDVDGDEVWFTTIGTWRGPFAPIYYEGERYGQRAHAFRELFELPSRTGASFVAALDIHPDEQADLAALQAHGWELIEPATVASSAADYRSFVGASCAELMVARHSYTASRSGWISDRSVCFLASGRPVLASDTCLPDPLATGEGLVLFSGLDGAIEGVRRISDDPARHAAAARRLAEEQFDSDIVLPRLLERLGVG